MIEKTIFDPDLAENHWWFRSRRLFIRSYLMFAAFDRKWPNLRILDAGCGTGVNLATLAEFGAVLGVDNNLDALRMCPRIQGAEVGFANITYMQFPSHTFDMVTMFDVLEHLPIPELALAEAARVLQPRGWLLVSVPALHWLWSKHDDNLGHHARYSKSQATHMIHMNGFEVVKARYAFGPLVPAIYAHNKIMDRIGVNPVNGHMPRWGRSILEKICSFEDRFLDMRWGSSVFILARKSSGNSSSIPSSAALAGSRAS